MLTYCSGVEIEDTGQEGLNAHCKPTHMLGLGGLQAAVHVQM